MALSSAFAAIDRTVRYFDGISVHGSRIRVKKPSAFVQINRSFFLSAASGIQIYSYLVVLKLARMLRRTPNAGRIAFYPQNAAPWYNIWIAAQVAGMEIVSKPEEADWVFVFDDSTITSIKTNYSDTTTPTGINHEIKDISKRYVGEVFESAFGYSLNIDPTIYFGAAVRKSETNGAHDGVIIQCPIEPSQVSTSQAYQKLVDSSFNGTTSEDLRVAYVLGEIPVVYHKHKKLEQRFGTNYMSVDLYSAEDVFSEGEILSIVGMCDEMGLDFGCIDVMRDKNDGRIYVIDVNKTCMPVLSLSFRRQLIAQRRIASALLKKLESRLRMSRVLNKLDDSRSQLELTDAVKTGLRAD